MLDNIPSFSHHSISEMSADLIRHFLVSFASEAKINIHARIMSGINDHHKAEAAFKALALSLKQAVAMDPRRKGVPSSKGVI